MTLKQTILPSDIQLMFCKSKEISCVWNYIQNLTKEKIINYGLIFGIEFIGHPNQNFLALDISQLPDGLEQVNKTAAWAYRFWQSLVINHNLYWKNASGASENVVIHQAHLMILTGRIRNLIPQSISTRNSIYRNWTHKIHPIPCTIGPDMGCV